MRLKTTGLKPIIGGLILFVMAVGLVISCSSAYYNTFFNARQAFNQAESTRKESGRGRIDAGSYQKAIEKSLKVLEYYPDSKWYDDALFVLGVSYYFTEQPAKADRRFRELLANYENSEYTKDATVYLARTKLQLGEEDDAMAIFEDIFGSDYSRENKTQAALSLGMYYYERQNRELSETYYKAVRDSLGNSDEKTEAQLAIALGQFEAFQFGDALGSYLQLLGMDPSTENKYIALHQAAICAFRLQRVTTGIDYLKQLSDDELYFDSIDALKLDIAEGYEMDGDIELAYDLYSDVANQEESPKRAAYANYRLGLINQFDYDDLTVAKRYYDLTIKNDRRSEIGQDALQRSTDIGKLLQFSEKLEFDSTATQQAVDDAAYTQFLLAELYWFSLDKPDSAIAEMKYMVDSFPGAYDTPNGMIALSQMYREYYADSSGADSILHTMLERYPHSDYVPEALQVLGLEGTEADTGYAEWYIHRAEDFLLDEENVDSALANYQVIVDRFPESKYYTKAIFNKIAVAEMYDNPGDSSIYYAYQEFVDSFPGTEYTVYASQKLSTGPTRFGRIPSDDDNLEEDKFAANDQDTLPGSEAATAGSTDNQGSYSNTLQSLYVSPDGDTIVLLDLTPVDIIEPFEFPESAISMKDNYAQLYFQVLLDFSGTVIEAELKTPSSYDEMNSRAERTVRSMTFNPADVSTLIATLDLPEESDGRGHWFVYKYLINKPEFLR